MPESTPDIIQQYSLAMDFGVPPRGARRSEGLLHHLSRGTLSHGVTSGQIEHRRFKGPKALQSLKDLTTTTPLIPQNHPRLLFTANNLPSMRATAQTEQGQILINRLIERLQFAEDNGFNKQGAPAARQANWAVGHGLLYQMTGEQHHADRAADLIWESMTGALADGQQHQQAGRILGTALAYDLCYAGWNQEIRAQTYHFLLRQALHFTNRRDIADPLAFGTRYDYQGETIAKPAAQSAHQFHRYVMAAGLGAEAIRFDPPPTLAIPSLEHIPSIDPAEHYSPPIGVPVGETHQW